MHAERIAVCERSEHFPAAELPEIAVIGRSNCGKSSLINAITGHNGLARTSSTPGRTRALIFFRVVLPGLPPFVLVDLPGYGFARVSRQMGAQWDELITSYIETRDALDLVLLLNDIRRTISDEERDLIQWFDQRQLDRLVILTKGDKLAKNQRPPAAERARRDLSLARRPTIASVRDVASIVELRRQLGSCLRRIASASTQ